MNTPLFKPRKRRAIMTLQLTAMIDIFSLIVIFLIKGTVFGASDIAVPPEMRLPTSVSKESVESAPRVVIGQGEVRFSGWDETLPSSLFESREDARLAGFKSKLKAYVGSLSEKERTTGAILNVIADRDTPYREVYDTIQVFRECGFESVLFVATGEKP